MLSKFLSDQCMVYADLPGWRASDSPQATVPPSILITSSRPDIVIHNTDSGAVALLELTCPLELVHHLELARDRKLGKEEYQLLLSELDRLGVASLYNTIEISVLGHYLPVSLSSFCSCVNFIQSGFSVPTTQCRKVFDEAAAISIRSSRRVFMARNCLEWCVDT